MKKVLLFILLTLLPLLANAEKVEIDGIWYNLVPKAKEAEVQYSGSYSGSIKIPASVTYNEVKYSVTSIGESAFEFCSGLTSVTIPNSVESIGRYAFIHCSGLKSVTITDIAAWCNILFDGDSSNPLQCGHLYIDGKEITNLVIPASVTSIGDYAFYNCKGLTSVTIPNSVTSIGKSTFWGCKGLTSLTIPNSVTSIGSSAFSFCSGLTSVTIPNSVTSIGESTFQKCTDLTSLTIPNSVTSIGSSAFSYCSGLTSVTIPISVTSIGKSAFEFCSGLTSVTIPNNVTSIGSNAFSGCTGLTSVTIGSGVATIGEQAFANCDDLADVYCLTEKPRNEEWSGEGLYTHPNAFMNSFPEHMTLHVPSVSIEAYRSTAPWSLFKAIVAIEDGDNPEIKKCATPEISYANGKVTLSCETEGIEFISEVTVADAKKYYDSEFSLSQTYKISVYATKAGYENSDVATREIVIENGQSSLFGDLNKDGKVNVADHVKLSDIIMNK